MALISFSTISDGTTGTASQVNTPLTTIYNDYNGNITDANVSASASIGAQKIAGGIAGMFGAWTTYTPSQTGFSSTTILTARYIQIGKTVIFDFNVSGTSNATTTTITVPIAAKLTTNIGYQVMCPGVVDNSAGLAAAARAILDASSNATTINLYKDSGGTGWTAAGTKACNGILIYEAA